MLNFRASLLRDYFSVSFFHHCFTRILKYTSITMAEHNIVVFGGDHCGPEVWSFVKKRRLPLIANRLSVGSCRGHQGTAQ